MRTPASVDHCCSFLVFLTGSLSALALARIDSLATESTRGLTIRVLDRLPLLPAGMTSLTKIIGLKCLCFSLFLDLVYLTILDGLRRVEDSLFTLPFQIFGEILRENVPLTFPLALSLA